MKMRGPFLWNIEVSARSFQYSSLLDQKQKVHADNITSLVEALWHTST